MSILSIYVSAFNLENGLFDWKESLDKMYAFADELVIATTTDSKDNTIQLLEDYTYNRPKCILVITDISLQDPLFDGKIKNAALQSTTLPAKILLDLDEFPLLSQKKLWINYFKWMISENIDCIAIPSVNLCQDIYHYKDIGHKFYLHRAGLHRGVVKYARKEDGSIDIKLSDTTEILNENNELPRIISLWNDIESLKTGSLPMVFHKWAIGDLNNRINQNKFWLPIWESRAKQKVDDIILNKQDIEKIEVFPHGLPLE